MKESSLAPFVPYGFLAVILGVLGGMNIWLSLLCWLIAGNYFFGTVAAFKETAFSFNKWVWGVVENLGLFFVVIIGNQLSLALKTPSVRDVVIFSLIGWVGTKCAKNMNRLGIYLPTIITDNFSKMDEGKDGTK